MIDTTGPIAGGLTAALVVPLLAEPHRPRVTTYTELGRTELSTASLVNWSAKVAGLLTDEIGVGRGDPVAVLLQPGWQTVPVLLGAWWCGAVVTDLDDADAAAAFVADGADAAADDVFVVSGHPLGASSTRVLAHQRDFTAAVLPQADRFSPRSPVAGTDPVLRTAGTTLDLDTVLAAASAVAGRIGFGARILTNRPWDLAGGLVDALLGPLAATGSVVQVRPDIAPEEAQRISQDENASIVDLVG